MKGSAVPTVRTRSNVYSLIRDEGTWPAALRSYQAGVAKMRARDPADPTTKPTNSQSWQYLAAIHGRAIDGEANDDIDVASYAMWSTCQHGSWFFLPWHRMYLLTLEAFIRFYSGDDDWSVPYWYAIDPDDPTSDVLPKAFRDRFLPSSLRDPATCDPNNALYIEQRSTRARIGAPIFDTDLLRFYYPSFYETLRQLVFSVPVRSPVGSYFGFGGAEFKKPRFDHGRNGGLEVIPHGITHDYVGSDFIVGYNGEVKQVGETGWMAHLATAARDPIFWLHHSNIDRLWQVWLDLDLSHENPCSREWLETSFGFPTPDGRIRKWKVKDVLDTTALGYEYDDISPPRQIAAAAQRRARLQAGGPLVDILPTEPPIVLGSQKNVAIVGNNRAAFRLDNPPSSNVRGLTGPAVPRQWLLTVGGVTGTVAAPTYGVYVNLPQDADAADYQERYAGIISTFGLRAASSTRGEHAGDGLTFVFDITDVHDELEENGQWRDDRIDVAFVPLVPPAIDEEAFAQRPMASADLVAGTVSVSVR